MINKLKTKVEQVYGMPIKYGNQCQQLSLFIFEQTGEYISFQTLRRFFGFIDKDKKPTTKTLDILSKLCGYRHFEEFCKHNKKQKSDNLIESIYSISLRKEEDLNYHYVCKNIAYSIYNNLEKLEQNITFLSSSKIAQEYFFERFPFIDHLNNPIYRRAILLYCKTNKSIDANVFVETSIYLADYLKNGKPNKLPKKLSLQDFVSLHPFLQARLIGTYLIGSNMDKKELVRIAFDYEKKQNKSLLYQFQFPFFNYMMADYFIICKMYEEAVKIIELGNYNQDTKPTSWLETGYFETLVLLYCIGLYGSGNASKAEKIFDQINNEHFHFIFKKYYTIQYLNLKKKLKGKISLIEQHQLRDLYNETKFFHL